MRANAGLYAGWHQLYRGLGGMAVFKFNTLLFVSLLTFLAYTAATTVRRSACKRVVATEARGQPAHPHHV